MADSDKFQMSKETIDKVRASKAGHAFHEAWAARSALELLLPHTSLMAITLEGFSQVDEAELGVSAVEIADLVRYFGASDVARASRTEIVQFKYSIASAQKAVRATDLCSTLLKFAKTDTELRALHGAAHVRATVRYDFATNRPIHPKLVAAIRVLLAGEAGLGDVAKQLEQLTTALADYPYPPSELLDRLSLSGTLGSLTQVEGNLATVLATWSEPSDPDAEIRLLKLRNLVRTKAGPGSEADKRIDRVAVLAELQVDHEDRLYPTPSAFPEVTTVIERSVLDVIVAEARVSGLPLILHGAGGTGKTVLIQNLADRLHADGPVVLFDGYGAGRWRDLADGRHRPERTLVHLANLLAGKGLCDILLPIADITTLLRAFRRRLEQAAIAARQSNTEAAVTLVLDAIDHAGLSARDFGTQSFAHVLLRSLSVSPIYGVRIVASCRTERLAIAVGDSAYHGFQIPAFSECEAKALISARLQDARPEEIAALLTRSGRNPRCLASLIDAGRPFDPVSMPGGDGDAAQDVVDALIEKRLADARHVAIDRGASTREIDLLLAGLALLPPPVPVDELALACDLAMEQVESFATDLLPLLERTPHGLIFRDEPTETLICKRYGQSNHDRRKVVEALQSRQDISNYAARALPALLTALGDANQLFALAFEKRVPPGASQVSTRSIRLARITAALALAGNRQRRDDLLQLLFEASLIAAGHERSDRFLYEHPDLAAIAGDAEALRRLASTTVGWPGGKHASLALANAFVGELDEARRNGRRAIDWYNWSAKSGPQAGWRSHDVSREWDDVGFTYIEMLTGNDIRVVRFYLERGEIEAYAKFNTLFDLLERHRKLVHPPTERLTNRLRHCRSRSRTLPAIALRYSDRDPVGDTRLLAQLAAAIPGDQKGEGLSFNILLAAARAFQLGITGSTAATLRNVKVPVPSIHDYSSYWPTNQLVEGAVLAAGVKAAIRGRPPNLLDIAPSEFLAIVPQNAKSRGPATFTRALGSTLAGPRFDGTVRRRQKTGIEPKLRSEYAQTLSHRIEPLLKYAQAVADIIRPPRHKTREAMATAALGLLMQDVTNASDYPYRDGKAYRARIGFHVIFSVVDALDLLNPAIADRFVDWLATAPGLFTPQLTETVLRLSRIAHCHTAALKLASVVERRIQLDTDVATRVTAYGLLGRAVWRVGTAEAAVYFRRALSLAEAIGSDDFDRTNHLLELTSHYSGPELPPNAGHTLARIFELNQSDDSKFPWIEYAKATVPTSGLATLATIARLDDRDAARLGLSLGPALTILVQSGKLPSDLASAIIGLAPPSETWTWRLSDFAAAVLDKLPSDRHRWFFEILLIEVDREDQLSPSAMTIDPLCELAQRHLAAGDALRDRIEALAARRQREAHPASAPIPAAEPELLPYPAPLDDPDAIDHAVLSEDPGPFGQRWPARILGDLAAHAITPEQRFKFVKAVVESSASSLSDKVRALVDPLKGWAAVSPALREALPSFALRLAAKHPRELAASGSDAWGAWRHLLRDFQASQPALVEHIVAALGPEGTELGGDSWLALASKLTPSASSQACAAGLERFLAQSADLLPNEVGDGPWHAHFLTPDHAAEVVAGLIWARLGHPNAALRWRAAHAIRRLAAVGRFDVISCIVDRFERMDALPFVDAKLPFYPLHARLWLLMALARIGRDAPHELLSYRTVLEKVAFSTEFPHVVMRAVAVDALRATLPAISTELDRDQLARRLDAANQSPFPHDPKTDYGEKRYIQRPAHKPRPADVFYLDYDFNKYHVEPLCRVFGCAGWEVEDLIHKYVRRLDKGVKSMRDCPRRSSDDESWSSGHVPDRDRYGGYLGWHGLMLAAGELLASRPVTGKHWNNDAWSAFLADYLVTLRNGLWLADTSDLFPLDLPSEASLAMPKPGETSKAAEDHALLAPMLGISSDGKLNGDWLPVGGHWSLSNDLDVTIRTVVADSQDAKDLVMALLAQEPFFRWLPCNNDEIARCIGQEGHSVRAWIEQNEHSERKFDRQDPYAASSSIHRPRPLSWVCDMLDLSREGETSWNWTWNNGIAFRTDAWGAEGGRGESAWSMDGARLFAHRSTVLDLLQRTGLHLVGHLKLRCYHREESWTRTDSAYAFTFRSLTFSIDPQGKIWAPRGLSRAARKAVQTVETRDRHELDIVFKALSTRD